MKISVKARTLNKSFFVKFCEDEKIFLFNDKQCKMNMDEFKHRLLDIVVYWDRQMVAQRGVFEEEFEVKIDKDGEIFSFYGYGKYPRNYSDFIRLLEDCSNLL